MFPLHFLYLNESNPAVIRTLPKKLAGQRFNRLLKKSFEWFDRLTTNGLTTMDSMSTPFALSLSKGGRRVFQLPVNEVKYKQ